jgi:SAM-dependent methyltransferase
MSNAIVDQVREKYAAAARSSISNSHAGVQAVAEAFGYSPDELAALPADANLGLSCGNPTATAHLRPGEVVVDLGCGGGIDVLLAARKVGPTGKSIGIDMTPEMLDRARCNASKPVDGRVPDNVEFLLGTIDHIPLADQSADCLISNCVINLAPDKAAVFREMFRVLKHGGRVAVSDIALKKPLPAELAQSVSAYVGCIAGAIPMAEYEAGLLEAGFADVQIVDTKKDLNAYSMVEGQSGCCSPQSSSSLPMAECCASTPVHDGLAEMLKQHDVNAYAASVQVFALKR